MNLTDINEIREILGRNGFHFSKSLGQNFLTAAWVPERIAEVCGADADVGVLEVGPGIGCLTQQLSKRAAKVVAVELDSALKPVLADTLKDCENVEIIFGDVLRQNLKQLAAERLAGLRPVVCANLPYNVTTPLLTAFLEADCFETITVMIQREVARRICAGADCADYGAFSVFVQWYCDTQLLFDVPPSCFIPQPKVTSSVIRLTRRHTPLCPVADEKVLMKVVRAAFNQRRKTLVNALNAGMGIPKETTEQILRETGLDERVRGEALDIVTFAKITDKIVAIQNSDL